MEIAIAIEFKAKGILIMKKELTIIGIIPQYPRHSQNNIYAKIKMPPVGILSVMSQIAHHPRCKERLRDR